MLAAVMAWVCVPSQAAPPQRIVSLNLCADQILIDLVPRQRIAALSHLADDPKISAISERVSGVPLTRGEAEVVLGFDPDLVIAGTFSTPATIALLERLGRRVEKVPLASDINGVRILVREIAAAVGESPRGETVLADFERRLAVAAAPGVATGRRPTALVYQVNGLASGTSSLANAVLTAAGFDNLAAKTSLGPGGQIALEQLLIDPPDLLVLTGPVDEYRTAVAANLRHPAVAALRQQRASIVLPWRHWLCGTPYIATAIETLSAERARLSQSGASR
ncbi:MAG: ABC transporter substrate-binding protein [Hyphomicrobiaceae bacterium]